MRSEKRLEEAEAEVKRLRKQVSILEKRVAQQQEETERTVPPLLPMRGSGEPDMRGVFRKHAVHRSRRCHCRRSIYTTRHKSQRRDRPAFHDEGVGRIQEARPVGPIAVPTSSDANGPVAVDEARDRLEAMLPLPLFQSPSSRASLPVRNRQFPQGNNEDGRLPGIRDVSETSDGDSRSNDASNRAATHSASVPSDVDLDIEISYEDSPKEMQTRDDPCATSLKPPTDYVLANEDDYLAKDPSESHCATSLEPPAE